MSTMNATSPNEENVTQTKIVHSFICREQTIQFSFSYYSYISKICWSMKPHIIILENLKRQKLIRTCCSINEKNDDADGEGRWTRSMMETDKKNSGRRQGSMRDARETFERRLPAPTMESQMNGN